MASVEEEAVIGMVGVGVEAAVVVSVGGGVTGATGGATVTAGAAMVEAATKLAAAVAIVIDYLHILGAGACCQQASTLQACRAPLPTQCAILRRFGAFQGTAGFAVLVGVAQHKKWSKVLHVIYIGASAARTKL